MYKITLPSGRIVEVNKNLNLRSALKHIDPILLSELYHPKMKPIHCRGLGTCGTCAVIIEGNVSEPTKIESWRLNFKPHKNSLEKGLRLACQCKAKGDLILKKASGLWGQGA